METRIACALLLLLAVLIQDAAAASTVAESAVLRWKRQALHCQPGDSACSLCSGSCDAVEVSRLPECCEAYNACCDHYFKACKQCSNILNEDKFFPEYCCASFTDCCDLITTFSTEVKAPTSRKSKSKVKADIPVPITPAPRPEVFPGISKSLDDEAKPFAPVAPAAPVEPAASVTYDAPVALDAPVAPEAPVAPVAPVAPRAPFSADSAPASPARSPAKRGRGSGSRQSGAGGRGGARRQPQQNHAQGAAANNRRGRVTSRGRVL
ncbi:translation initiation factor IF-2-like [Penaeus japonicus]|uniref:translation initiation factor IF-2-like n=1 Tax=Penaeus japonicus TaxID=27405 RepID=UPI001C70AFF7|nr:translation initiation factor IF-2-like [Penaeus japonicus]